MDTHRRTRGRTGAGVLLLIAISVLALAACGPDGGGGDAAKANKTFRDDDFGITFAYPNEFRRGQLNEGGATHGGEPEARVALALDDYDYIGGLKYDVGGRVTHDDLPTLLPELNEIVADLTSAQATGSPVTVGGLPGVTYADVPVPGVPGGRSRLVYLFDGSTEYFINCQSTPAHRDALTEACEGALATLEKKGSGGAEVRQPQ